MRFRWTAPIPGPHAVARLEYVPINGVDQAVLIRGEDRRKPLLLMLHGGPGTAQIGAARVFTQQLERDFVVVNWDQRGAGLSYSSAIPPESMTIDQFVADARALITWLLREFGQEKLYLVGHSWGTVLGTLCAARFPHLLHAYVGMGQVVNMVQNEALSYQFALDAARRAGHRKAIRQLERIGPPPYRKMQETGVQRRWLNRFGGASHNPAAMRRLIMSLLLSTEYRLIDLINWFRGMNRTLELMWDSVLAVDLPREVPALAVPVYFLLGRYDHQTPHELAAAYFDRLGAPYKRLIWFEESAHLLFFEEPDTFARSIRAIQAEQQARDASPKRQAQ